MATPAANAPFSITYAITDKCQSSGPRPIEARNHNLLLSLQNKLFEKQIANITNFIIRFKSSLTISAEARNQPHLESDIQKTCLSLSNWADILGKFYVMRTLNPFTYSETSADEYLNDFIKNYEDFLTIARKIRPRSIRLEYDSSHADSLIAEVAKNCFHLRKDFMSPQHLNEGLRLLKNSSRESHTPQRPERQESPRRLLHSIDAIH